MQCNHNQSNTRPLLPLDFSITYFQTFLSRDFLSTVLNFTLNFLVFLILYPLSGVYVMVMQLGHPMAMAFLLTRFLLLPSPH